MPILKSIQSGNFTDSSTWAVVDQNSFLYQTTSTIGGTGTIAEGSNFTVSSNITISGVMLHIAAKAFAATGNVVVRFHNVTTATDLKTVTLNLSDLPFNETGNPFGRNVGWVFFKFDTPITLNTTQTYRLRISNSAGTSQIAYYGTAGNTFDRALVTTTNTTPISGDTLFVVGENISASTFNRFTVTMNNTSSVPGYGLTFIDTLGTLRWADTPSSNFHLRIANNIFLRGSGELIMGDDVTPIPSSTTCSLEITCASPAQFGITIASQGLLNTRGADTTVKTEINGNIVTGNWVQTPNNVATQLTGDFEIEIQNLTFKSESGAQSIYAKYNDFSNPTSNLMVGFSSNTSRLFLTLCQGSSQFVYIIPSNLNSNTRFIKITRNSTTGLIEFYQSTDGIYSTPFHTVTGITGSINAGTIRSTIATREDLGARFTGSVGRIILRKSIGGAISADFNMADYVSGTTMVSGGLTWTFNSVPSPTIPDLRFSTSDAFFITSIPVDWVTGDGVVVAGTSRSATQNDVVTVSSVSGNTVYISNTFSFPHLGTGDIVADVAKLNRNVKIFATSPTNFATSIFLGSNTTRVNLNGIEIYDVGATNAATIAGNNISDSLVTCKNSSFYFTNIRSGSFIIYGNSSYKSDVIDNNFFYNSTSFAINGAGLTPTTAYTVTNNISINTGGFNFPIHGNFNNNIACGGIASNNVGITLQAFFSGTMDNCKIYSVTRGLSIAEPNVNGQVNPTGFTINNLRSFRNSVCSIQFNGAVTRRIPLTFINSRLFGSFRSIDTNGSISGNFIFKDSFFWGGSGETSSNLFLRQGGASSTHTGFYFDNCNIGLDYNGNTSNFSSAILILAGLNNSYFNNCLFSGTESSTPGVPIDYFPGYVSVNHNRLPGSIKTFKSSAILTKDTSITYNGLPTVRVTPQSASFNATSDPVKVAVRSGQTLTISVKVRKSASPDTAYGGIQPQLVHLINPLVGNFINTSVVTGVTANGIWETLSYTTPIINNDTTLDFYVICNGTTGFINVTDWDASLNNNSKTGEFTGVSGLYTEPDHRFAIKNYAYLY
jgi:hypothetical protein